MSPGDWRALEDEDIIKLTESVGRRLMLGRETYGLTFVGDPLEHALMEALDLVVYLTQETKRREAKE